MFIRDLAEVGAADRAVAGGKAAGLGELARTQIATPPGFVLTADAFRLAMAVIDRSGSMPRRISALDAADTAAIAAAAGAVRARIATASLPSSVAEAVAAGYAWLGVAPAAVRSSGTMEDGAAASFAGLQDSYLGVHGLSAVLDAVRRCWASLYNNESVAYRRRIGMPEDGVAMAVIVQRMVRPRAAGVMFTLSPGTGDRSVIAIEATWGLGSALVAGEVTPDGFTVSKVTGEITARRSGAKHNLHACWQNGQGSSAMPVSGDMASRPCLTDDEVRALARVAQRVEDHYGVPQDIEWALTAAGGIVLLQSRPETAWTARGRAPRALPRPRACDHVLGMFGSAQRWS